MSRWVTRLVLITMLAAGGLAFLYERRDLEDRLLDDTARQQIPGSFIPLSDGLTYYHWEGPQSGEPVVLVHGFSIPSFIWEGTAETLARQGYRVLRFDLYGRGFSDRPAISYSLDAYVRQLEELVEQLLPDGPAHFVGLSMGGPIVTRYAHRHPGRVRTVSLLAPLVSSPDRWEVQLMQIPAVGEYMATVVMMPRVRDGLREAVVDPGIYPQWRERMEEHIHFKGYRFALLTTLRHLAGRDFGEDYRRLAGSGLPVQVLWGREDPVVPPEQGLRLQQDFGWAVNWVPECGHLPQIEAADAVIAWLLRGFESASVIRPSSHSVEQ